MQPFISHFLNLIHIFLSTFKGCRLLVDYINAIEMYKSSATEIENCKWLKAFALASPKVSPFFGVADR